MSRLNWRGFCLTSITWIALRSCVKFGVGRIIHTNQSEIVPWYRIYSSSLRLISCIMTEKMNSFGLIQLVWNRTYFCLTVRRPYYMKIGTSQLIRKTRDRWRSCSIRCEPKLVIDRLHHVGRIADVYWHFFVAATNAVSDVERKVML